MKSGTVAVVGRANAGKSTLVNVLVGEKVAIVSPKPQTTRDRIYGVLTTEEYQIVFEDTPGIYRASTTLNSRMQRAAESTAKETDIILFVVDGHTGLKDEDLDLAQKFAKVGAPMIVAFTKTDIMPKENIPQELVKLAEISGVTEIVPVSARKGRNVKELLAVLLKYLPEGDYVFNPDAISDKSEKFMIAEIMREKILLKYDREIPHGVAVVIEEYREGILVGSGCVNGEIWRNAFEKTEEDIEKVLEFYDYIEVQPPVEYLHLFRTDEDETDALNKIKETISA